MEQSKWVLTSKSVWFALITAAAAFYSPAADFVASNVEAVGLLWGTVSFVLRLVTKDKVVLKP